VASTLLQQRQGQMFPKLTPAQLARLEHQGTRLQTHEGEILQELGEVARGVFIVAAGSVEALVPPSATQAESRDELLYLLTPGDFTGEMSTLRGTRVFARIRVREPGAVLMIDAEQLRRIVQNDAELSELFMRAFILRRMGVLESGRSEVLLLGSDQSADTLRLREFLTRNTRPYVNFDIAHDAGAKALLERFDVRSDDIPVAITLLMSRVIRIHSLSGSLASRGVPMLRSIVTAAIASVLTLTASAAIVPFPASFQSRMTPTNGTTLNVRAGGKGPAVVLLHGFGDTGDMWAPLAAVLVKDHTVIVPDLRGMGLSAHPDTGYTKKNQAADVAGIMDALQVQQGDLVTHDIGNMVGYALAAQYPSRIRRWVVIDAPLPGVGNWDTIVRSPLLWHFNFRGPDVERLVQGRERIYLDRFWNELSANPKTIDEATREHYASLYAQPHAMHDAFEQFAAFNQDAIDNKASLATGGKLAMPVLALGAEKSFGSGMAQELRFVAKNVTGDLVPSSGHWIMEENPQATVRLVTEFLHK